MKKVICAVGIFALCLASCAPAFTQEAPVAVAEPQKAVKVKKKKAPKKGNKQQPADQTPKPPPPQ